MRTFWLAILLFAAGVALRGAEDHRNAEGRKEFLETKAKADQGDARAQFSLGVMFANGQGAPKNETEAAMWYRKAADQGFAKAQNNLGIMHAEGQGVPKDEAEAVKWYRRAADQGDVQAQASLGLMYSTGRGVPKDEAEAVEWYRKSADQGLAAAQFSLGLKYSNGQGVAQDEVQAAIWYRKAADQGDADAQGHLGVMYANGQGVPKDEAEAVKWYRKAADQANAPAQSNLGVMYETGRGVPKDEVEAVKWYRKAADQANAPAQFNLGNTYAEGRGVPKDETEAAKWYRKSANQGYVEAQFRLGSMYNGGQSVPKDEVEAYKWWLLAGAQGDETAKKNFGILERRMTAEQRAEGQKLAREFKPRKASAPDSPDSREHLAQAQPESSGSGFVITNDGYFITNQHVAGEGATVRVLTAAGTIPARVVKVDRANDLALLKAEGRFTALPVIASRSARLGATVATVGFPNIGLQGFAPKLAKGEIASLAGAQDDARHFQISAPIQPGNSGGALVDERGNVIGVVVAKLSQQAALATSGSLAENVNYAVKSSYLLSFLESVPEVAAKLKEPNTKSRPFEDVVKDVEQATVLVLVY